MRFHHTLRTDLSRFLLAALPLACCTAVRATDYYVSASGNDANNGTSQGQAWQTIDRVNQLTYNFLPGDRILFQRGGTYRGELNIGSSGSSGQQITIGAFGSGALPIISGSALVTGWTLHQGNIWKASIGTGQTVKYVFVNGQMMTLARFPNTGWLRNDNGGGTFITDAALTQANGYWTGATAVIRSTNWSYDAPVITGFSGGTLSFSDIYYNLSTYDWGYFLCNKLSELDAPGEWFYDQGTGQLYLWAMGNDNPNTLTVEAGLRENGVMIGWNRQYIKIQDIGFKHQRTAGVKNDGGHHITASGCTFQYLYQGIRSYGTYNTYSGNTFTNVLATAAYLIDNNTTLEGNTFDQIAMVPGLGESNWGYFGVRSIGTGNIIRANQLEDIGYIGIVADNNCLIEKNTVHNAMALLNDGGGIAFDNADGMTIRDNIVTDIVGNLESSAPDLPNYLHIGHGIYFGNTVIKNTLVQHNTVANCAGAGIHVDHTMVSTGNQIKDNILFNNQEQLSISDWSNYNGPGATAPYYVANFNDVYTGNVMYCLTKDQRCMRIYNCHGNTPVDFGTFDQNRYFNPYEELSIFEHNTFSGVQTSFTLESWRAERGDDPNSTRSALHLNEKEVTSVLTGNLIVNGDFDYNVNGWDGWPTNADVTHDYTYLDNGALKAYLPNANQYPSLSLRNPDQFTVQNNQWYRLSFSLQSNIQGIVHAGVKGMTQMSGPNMVAERAYPFSTERRDMEFIFQSGLADQALAQFTHNYTTPTYWLDNVTLERVQVTSVDPSIKNTLLVNTQGTAQNFTLTGCWSDVDGALHSGSVNLGAYSSMVLVREADADCGLSTPVEEMETADPSAGGIAYPNPINAGEELSVNTTLSGPVEVSIMDPQGKLSHRAMLASGTGHFTLPQGFAPGMYLLHLSGATGAIQQRVIIQ